MQTVTRQMGQHPVTVLDPATYPGPKGDGSSDTFTDEQALRDQYWGGLDGASGVIDVGACFGAWTVHALAQGAFVLAVEPLALTSSEGLDILTENVRLSGGFKRYLRSSNVLWDGTPYPTDLWQDVFANDLVTSVLPAGFTPTLCGLDSLVLLYGMRKVSHMKLDVEGAEAGVLRGAARTLEKHRPRLLIELHDYEYCRRTDTEAQCLTLLGRLNYRMAIVTAEGRRYLVGEP
jgi:hypothetical protein